MEEENTHLIYHKHIGSSISKFTTIWSVMKLSSVNYTQNINIWTVYYNFFFNNSFQSMSSFCYIFLKIKLK